MSCVTGWPTAAALCTAALAAPMRPFNWNGAGPKPRMMNVPLPYAEAVHQAFVVGAEIVAANEQAVRMWMAVQIHVLRFSERGFHGVVAAGLVGRIPEVRRRSRGDVQIVAFLHELRIFELAALCRRARV